MVRLQKALQVKTHMRAVFETSRIRLLKEFGADNKAHGHVSAYAIFFSSCVMIFLLSKCSLEKYFEYICYDKNQMNVVVI